MRHRRIAAPINTIKHYVQQENATIADAARRSVILVDAVSQSAAGSNVRDILEGSLVKAMFIESWVKSNASAGTDTKFQFVIEKVPAGQSSITFTQMNTMMAYPNKKNVFLYSQGVIGDLTTQAIPIIRDWIKIPKGKQRFGLGDRLVISIGSTGAIMQNCGFSTYKEWK